MWSVYQIGVIRFLNLCENSDVKLNELGYGKEYQYSHNRPMNTQEFLPAKINGNPFYKPSNNSKENTFRERLKNLWKEKYNY